MSCKNNTVPNMVMALLKYWYQVLELIYIVWLVV